MGSTGARENSASDGGGIKLSNGIHKGELYKDNEKENHPVPEISCQAVEIGQQCLLLTNTLSRFRIAHTHTQKFS